MSEDRILKNGAVILVAGYTNERKSTIVRELIKDSGLPNKIAFDVNREYWTEKKPSEWTVFYDFAEFKKSMSDPNNGARQCAVVFDEASQYVRSYKDDEIAKLFIGCEHKFIALFMLFTSLADIPNSLVMNSHYLILFRTMDTADGLTHKRKVFIPLLPLKKDVGKPVFVDMRQLVGAIQAQSQK